MRTKVQPSLNSVDIGADGHRQRVYRVTIARDSPATLATDLPALRLTASGNPARIDTAAYFSDPDGDAPSYMQGRSSDPDVATVATVANADASRVVTPQAAGQTSAAVAAGDGSLSSETVTLSITVEAAAIAPEVRIAARRVSRPHLEVALQQRSPGGEWNERLLPRAWFLQTSVPLERWVVSTPLQT
ncbi:MAG: hypothetical protein OXH13_08495 [Chloroflexi bacterium]|nr:hypothetical protein [Chloroflexota bacterium]MCY3697508.1 hypothetical protein [Chloroflexota bacterium]MYB22682.1 hypothetical protein [Chloroflexota bacterium]MYF82491.1 hypothetical protein [Chloroflexota bacterium]MYI03277.1 hypothetical protein [Chloroflexota bacterium]